jgi:hypothetical protein
MPNYHVFFLSCVFALIGLSSASASTILPGEVVYVDPKNGNNANAGAFCPQTAPCADLNTALSVTTSGSVVFIMSGGFFGPIVLTGEITIIGTDLNERTIILADPTAQVGCIGHLPGSCGLTNNGYAVEVAAGQHGVTIRHVEMANLCPSTTGGALKFTSGGALRLSYDITEGCGASAALQLYPNNTSGHAEVFMNNSEASGDGTTTGAIEVKPSGNTSVVLQFDHLQVRDAFYGIRTDGSLLSGPSAIVSTVVSNSNFFNLNNAAMNAFSTAGTGTVQATFDTTKILNAIVGLKANGPLSSVVLTNNTVTGNGTGVQVLNSATVMTSGNNTIRNNGTNISGSLTPAPLN